MTMINQLDALLEVLQEQPEPPKRSDLDIPVPDPRRSSTKLVPPGHEACLLYGTAIKHGLLIYQ